MFHIIRTEIWYVLFDDDDDDDVCWKLIHSMLTCILANYCAFYQLIMLKICFIGTFNFKMVMNRFKANSDRLFVKQIVFAATNDIIREQDALHVNHTCRVFTSEANPRCPLIVYMKEMNMWGLEAVN
jgi:nicotinic acid phosphoribosyltransferase